MNGNLLKIRKDFIFNFYATFNDVNGNTRDHQMVIADMELANVPESFDEQYEFIMIDLNCNNSANILLNSYVRYSNYIWIIVDMEPSNVRIKTEPNN